MFLESSLFPPQVLTDLNFFRVRDQNELAFRLRTLQRVAAAAIGAYLFVRYEPILAKQLGLKCPLRSVVQLGIYMGSACLSDPMAVLWVTAVSCSKGVMVGMRNYRDNQIGKLVIHAGMVFYLYVASQVYKDFRRGPNLLERLFEKVEDKVTEPLWNCFYKK